MNKTRKTLQHFLCGMGIATSVVFSSCGKNKETTLEQKHIFHINHQGDFASIHPHTALDLGCRNMIISLFDGLFRIDAQDHPQKALVEHYEISEDKLTYTFTLKKSYWSNGEPLTADYFEKAWKQALAPNSNCLRPDLFYFIKNSQKAKKGVLSLDQVGIYGADYTLSIELEHPTPYIFELLAHPIFSPIFSDQKEPTVFNGPFLLKSWTKEEEMILEKNPHYWDKMHVTLDQVKISLVRDPSTALLLFEQGELDWMGSPFTQLPQDTVPLLQKRADYATKSISGVYWLSLNHQKFPLYEKNIRKALSLTINRKEIADKLLYGFEATTTILPPSLSFISKEENNCDQDREKAKDFFEEGLQHLQLERSALPALQILYSDIPGQKNIAQALQQLWQDTLDIKVELVNAEWNTFFSNLTKRNYQIGGCIWYAAFSDPIYYLEFFKEMDNRYNTAAWHHDRYSELLTLAQNTIDPEMRNAYLREAELLVVDELPVIPLYVHSYRYLKKEEVEGTHISNLGLLDLKNIKLTKTAISL